MKNTGKKWKCIIRIPYLKLNQRKHLKSKIACMV